MIVNFQSVPPGNYRHGKRTGPGCRLDVPDQILIGVFPKIRLYGFRRVEGRFAELLKVLEEGGATGLGGSPGALGIIDIGPADRPTVGEWAAV
jgi:hypothetical protein